MNVEHWCYDIDRGKLNNCEKNVTQCHFVSSNSFRGTWNCIYMKMAPYFQCEILKRF